MKIKVFNVEKLNFDDKIMYRVTGMVNSVDINDGLVQIYSQKEVQPGFEYQCKLSVSKDLKTLKIGISDKIEGSKSLFNK